MLEYLRVKAAIRANRLCGKRCESLQIQIKSNFMTPYTGVQLSDLVQMKNDTRRWVVLLWHWFPHPLDMGHVKLEPVQRQASAGLCLGLGRALWARLCLRALAPEGLPRAGTILGLRGLQMLSCHGSKFFRWVSLFGLVMKGDSEERGKWKELPKLPMASVSFWCWSAGCLKCFCA